MKDSKALVLALARGRSALRRPPRNRRGLHQLRKLYPDVAFASNDIDILVETPDKTFAEYVTHMTAAATGRLLHQLFTGYLVAEAGEIKLLRESFNPSMAQAQLPKWSRRYRATQP